MQAIEQQVLFSLKQMLISIEKVWVVSTFRKPTIQNGASTFLPYRSVVVLFRFLECGVL
jgi:hypothetical protein